MRPRASTWVASMMTSPAPETANLPRCIRCQSVALPSTALYWHIGDTTMRFCNVRPRNVIGENTALVNGAKLGVGAVAKWVDIGALGGALALSSLQGIIAQQATKPGRAVPALAANALVAKPSPRSTSVTPPAPELISSADPTQPAHSSAVEVPRAKPTELAKPEAPARTEGTLLAAEVRFVEEGRAALQRAEFADALTQLAPYESLFPRQQLLTEVLFLRMEALSRLGNVERARALARRILALGVVGRQAAQAHEVLGR